MENYRPPRKARSWRNSLRQERAHRMAFQYQLIIPENVHTSNSVQIEQAILRNIYMCVLTDIHEIAINENRGHEF